MRVLLIHAPKPIRRHRQLVGYEIMALPHGLLPLAALVRDAGHQVTVLHLGIERLLQPDLSLEQQIRALQPQLVGVTLQWHAQLAEGLQAARAVKSAAPHTPVVAGGLAASHFSEELLQWPALDFVIRGDAEQPLLALIERLEQGRGALHRVPNLSWRQRGGVVHNSLSYRICADELEALDDCALDLLRHQQHYSGHDRLPGTSLDSLRAQTAFRVFHLPVGRGCTANCAFCGGGRAAHRTLTGHVDPVLRSPTHAAEVIARVAGQGARSVLISFDPPGLGRSWHLELFRQVRARELQVGAFLELYHQPPDEPFISAFASAFRPRLSTLALSPHSSSAARRSRHGGPSHSRRQLDDALAAARAHGLRTACYFSSYPDGSWVETARTSAWALDLDRGGTRVESMPIEIEPRARWSLEPRPHGLHLLRRSLDDYLARHRGDEQTLDLPRRLGYAAEELEARVLMLHAATGDARPALSKALGAAGAVAGPVALCTPGQLELARELAGPGATYLVSGCRGFSALRDVLRALCIDDVRPAAVYCVAEGLDRLQEQPATSSRIRTWRARGAALEQPLRPSAEAIELWRGRTVEDLCRQAGWPQTKLDRTMDGCRWSARPCPAGALQRLLVDRRGAVRLCLAAPPLHTRSRAELARAVAQARTAAEQQRGCAHCPASQLCSRCPWCGPLPPNQFCALVRELRGGPTRV